MWLWYLYLPPRRCWLHGARQQVLLFVLHYNYIPPNLPCQSQATMNSKKKATNNPDTAPGPSPTSGWVAPNKCTTFYSPDVRSMDLGNNSSASPTPSDPTVSPSPKGTNYVTNVIGNKSSVPLPSYVTNRGFTEIGYVPKSRVIFKKNRWCPFCFFFVL